ncbi:MAG TPA: hypothetical protein PKM88_00965 [bacterium]|nr:hypothetical protein [bacterium]
MEKETKPEQECKRSYHPPELTRYQRLQDLTRGDSGTGSGLVETCSIAGQCEASEFS